MLQTKRREQEDPTNNNQHKKENENENQNKYAYKHHIQNALRGTNTQMESHQRRTQWLNHVGAWEGAG